MSLTTLSALFFLGQWTIVVYGQECPAWAGGACPRVDEIRRSDVCRRGGETGYQRPLDDPPTSEYQNTCICSSWYYSMVMACDICSTKKAIPWRQWHQNCKNDNVKNGENNYPELNISSWATSLKYADHERDGLPRFSFEAASTYVSAPPKPSPDPIPDPIPDTSPTTSLPPAPSISSASAIVSSPSSSPSEQSSAAQDPVESISPILSTPLSLSRPVTSSLPAATKSPDSAEFLDVPNPSDDPFGSSPAGSARPKNGPMASDGVTESNTPSKSPNLGALIGGIVGGLFVLLALVGVVYFIVLRRRRKRTPPSAAYMAQFGDSAGRVASPRPFSPDSSAPLPLGSGANSIETTRPDSPVHPRYSDDSPAADAQDPFSTAENNVPMRESTVSRASLRQYTRAPTPLMGPRAR